MFKRIIKNKSFLLSLLSFSFTLLAFVTVTFAWVAIAYTNEVTPFVVTTGDDDSFYFEFQQIIGDEAVDTMEQFKTDTSVPGEKSTFLLTLTNVGNVDSIVDVSFQNIMSRYKLDSTDEFTTNYSGVAPYKARSDKIQYSYKFNVEMIVHVPTDTRYADNIQTSINVPTVEYVTSKGWIIDETHSHESRWFNEVDESDQDLPNIKLVENLRIYNENSKVVGTASGQVGLEKTDYSTVFVFFSIEFNGTGPEFPDCVVDPGNVVYDNAYYADQQFYISNLLVQGKTND